jgi:2-desacetyl-2-hydroxyethyl bacteriochlorophyllide A dehydrogenase
MKALVYTAPKKLEMQSWPDPELKPGDALVRVRAAAVCGSDVHGWLGHSRGRTPPLILGHELAGEVLKVRDSGAASGQMTGQRVAIYPLLGCDQCRYCASGRDYLCRRRQVLGLHVAGGFAEYVAVPVKNLYPLPEETGFVEGALAEPLACGLHMAGLAARDMGQAAILGAGPIGLMMLQVARELKFPRIAVVEVNPHRAAAARQLGADLTVNPSDPNCWGELDGFFGEDGCAVVFDAAGFSATRQLALKLVSTGGLIVLAGLGEQETALDCVEIVRREIRLQGAFAYCRREFQKALEWVAGGRLNTVGWVREAALAEGQKVFEDLVSPGATGIKVVLRP